MTSTLTLADEPVDTYAGLTTITYARFECAREWTEVVAPYDVPWDPADPRLCSFSCVETRYDRTHPRPDWRVQLETLAAEARREQQARQDAQAQTEAEQRRKAERARQEKEARQARERHLRVTLSPYVVRDWARANAVPVPPLGPVPGPVYEAYAAYQSMSDVERAALDAQAQAHEQTRREEQDQRTAAEAGALRREALRVEQERQRQAARERKWREADERREQAWLAQSLYRQADVRTWAQSNGFPVAPQGSLPHSAYLAYHAAQTSAA